MITKRFISLKNTILGMSQLDIELGRDPKLMSFKDGFDRKVLAFLRANSQLIVKQAFADSESEVPTVPLFEDFIRGLELEMRAALSKLGYFNGVSSRLARHYEETFYYSSLSNMMGHVSCTY